MTFDPNNRETWPPFLNVEHMAALVDRSITYISKKATVGQFQPAPFRGGGRGHRWEWRKAEVVAFVDGAPVAQKIRRIA